MSEIVGEVELDWHKLPTPHLTRKLGENAHPTAYVAREDRLQGVPLSITGALIR
nr:hypothetical protein [Aquisalimonas sp.]